MKMVTSDLIRSNLTSAQFIQSWKHTFVLQYKLGTSRNSEAELLPDLQFLGNSRSSQFLMFPDELLTELTFYEALEASQEFYEEGLGQLQASRTGLQQLISLG
jgi:hypothetical protein